MTKTCGGLAVAWVSALLASDVGAREPARDGAAPSSTPAPASAPATDDAARTKARALGYAGVEAYAAGDYSEASAKLEESFQLLPVPSLGLWSARALVGLGHWVVAEQRYRAVAKLAIAPGDSPVQQKAKDDAQRERTELSSRIPSLKLRITGASVDEVAVSVDGTARGSAELATALLLDPGRHEIVGARGGERSQVVLTLAERAHEEIELRFSATPPTPALDAETPESSALGSAAEALAADESAADAARAAPSPALPARSASFASLDADAADASARSAVRIGAWIGVGIGAAGLATSLVSYLVADRQYSSFERRGWCMSGGCSQAEVDTYNDLRDVYQLSLIAGGVATVAGATLLVLTWGESEQQHPAQQQSAQQHSEQRAVRLELAPTRATLTGTF